MKATLLPKFIDYLLLNAYSVHSTGLYNGKAGLSLVLFEAARLLQNKGAEEHAFELLQEALTTQNPDIGFENGLSGVGFVLHYLIKNQFVEADFQEVFGEKLYTIQSTIEEAYAEKTNREAWIPIAYFLKNKQTVDMLVDRMYRELCVFINGFVDERIVLLRNKHDFIGSLNLGISQSVGKYIAHMDADDIMYADRLKIQYEIMEADPDITVCGTWVTIFGKNIPTE